MAQRSTATVRRDEILDAAVVEFSVNGLHGTSTDAIARRAGVSQPYVFRLFGTKKALFCATVQRGFERLMAAFAEAADRARDEGVHPFELMGRRYVELLADRHAVLMQMQGYIASADPEVRAAVQRNYGQLYEWLESLEPDPAAVHAFLSTGMLLNVAAAIDLPALVDSQEWAGRCLALGGPAATVHGRPTEAVR